MLSSRDTFLALVVEITWRAFSACSAWQYSRLCSCDCSVDLLHVSIENLARKFSTTQQASGVMSIMDMIQCGNIGLTQSIKKLDRLAILIWIWDF